MKDALGELIEEGDVALWSNVGQTGFMRLNVLRMTEHNVVCQRPDLHNHSVISPENLIVDVSARPAPPEVSMEEIDAAAVADFKNDLKGMSDTNLITEINEVSDMIDGETAWLEAMCAEQRIRKKKGEQDNG